MAAARPRPELAPVMTAVGFCCSFGTSVLAAERAPEVTAGAAAVPVADDAAQGTDSNQPITDLAEIPTVPLSTDDILSNYRTIVAMVDRLVSVCPGGSPKPTLTPLGWLAIVYVCMHALY